MDRKTPDPGTTVELRVAEGIVRVELRGVLKGPPTTDAIAAAVRVGHESGSSLILFDLRGLVIPGYHAGVVQRADNASRYGITAFRVAILGEPGSGLLAFIETVTTNRGLRTKCFTDEESAVDWLKAGPDP